MSICLDAYNAATANAAAQLSAALAACNGDFECERVAVDAHYQAIVAAYTAYVNCSANQEGEPGEP
jgi:hypothetical protein